MIREIDAKLNDWARWRLNARGNSKSPYPAYNLPAAPDADDAPPRTSYVPLNDSLCWAMDKCVVALNPLFNQVVMVVYTLTGAQEQKCRACGCGQRTLYYRLHVAHQEIHHLLEVLDSGGKVLPWRSPDLVLGIPALGYRPARAA